MVKWTNDASSACLVACAGFVGFVGGAASLFACGGAQNAATQAPTSIASSAADSSADVADAAPIDASNWRSQPEGKCKGGAGDPAPAFMPAVTAAARSTRACYNELLRRKKGAQGKFLVSLHVNDDGGASDIKLLEDDFKDPDMTACVIGKFNITYPSPETGCGAKLQVPVRFVDVSDAGAGTASP